MPSTPERVPSWRSKNSLPCADVSDFRGGASVNAIAADAHFVVDTAKCSMSKTKTKELVTKAVKAGVDAEKCAPRR